jgi:hypothetical protein
MRMAASVASSRGGLVYAEELAVNQALDLAADFVGFTLGIEFLLNVGAFDPFPAEFLQLGFTAGFSNARRCFSMPRRSA